MAADNSFRRGMMPLVILALLRGEDMYGYQLVQETERQSGGRITTQEGSLYPVLYKLQENGFISDRKVLVGKRMTRVYYHLEPKGEERLEELIQEYRSLSQGIFQIIEGGECDAESACCPMVSVEDSLDNASEFENEERNFGTGRNLRPGLCY